MDEHGYCPVCGAPVLTISIRGPGECCVGPCGHAVEPGHLLAEDPATDPAGETDELIGHDKRATGPEDVNVAYITGPAFRSWALHAARDCPLLAGRGRAGHPVDPAGFPFLGWCPVCSPWLDAVQPGGDD